MSTITDLRNQAFAYAHSNHALSNALYHAADEIERLRAENAALWERVKRWEPLADPTSGGSGRTNTGEDG